MSQARFVLFNKTKMWRSLILLKYHIIDKVCPPASNKYTIRFRTKNTQLKTREREQKKKNK